MRQHYLLRVAATAAFMLAAAAPGPRVVGQGYLSWFRGGDLLPACDCTGVGDTQCPSADPEDPCPPSVTYSTCYATEGKIDHLCSKGANDVCKNTRCTPKKNEYCNSTKCQ